MDVCIFLSENVNFPDTSNIKTIITVCIIAIKFYEGGEMKRFFVKRGIFFAALVCLIMFAACSANSAEEIFKTAQFEELQNNKEHAEQLYHEIIKKHPESEYAVKAKERISALKK